MTLLQEAKDYEDITRLDTSNTPHIDMQGPITRARAHRLNQEVSSFLCTFSNYKNGMLPNDVIRNNGEHQDVFRGRLGGEKYQTGRPSQAGGPKHPEFESALESWSSMD
jgi:hypothetical protein